MGLFHVYVEAPTRDPDTIKRLAETIGKKYGVPVADLEKRLTAGRFRVKANVDRETAEVYAKALGDSGARVKIEDAVATPPAGIPVVVAQDGSAPASRVPARPSSSSLPPRTTGSSLPPANAPRPSASSLPPANAPRPSASSLPPQNQTKSGPVVASGLSAAYTDSSAATDLGALGSDSISLSSLDGSDASGDDAFAPPVDLSPTVDKPAARPASAKVAKLKQKDEPLDLFAPPDAAEDAAFTVELAADEVDHRARKMSTPPAGVPVPIAPSPSTATPQLRRRAATPAAGIPITVSPDAQEPPRWQFAAGVVLSILLGFIPAHLIASSRERSAFTKIDREVSEQQAAADSPDLYDALDAFRSAKQTQKQGEKKSIAMLSMMIWGITGAGLAYVWFRRVPWDKLRRST
ncbi:MAG: hypothetical protein ABI175_08775 [Polyangiales bacterium]